MGNLESPINEIQALIQTIRKEVPSGRFFELGDDPQILKRIENHLEKFHHLLESIKERYSTGSVKKINRYSCVLSAFHRVDNFLKEVKNKAEGSLKNTSHFRILIDDLNKSITLLSDENGVEILGYSSQEKADLSTKNHEEPKKSFENGTWSCERSVFISYAWGGNHEEIANQIDEALQMRGLKIIRDKRDLGYKESIKDFMERIGHGNCVIVVVSDKYLRSPNCMFELVEIAENKQFHDRVFPIVLADANIYEPIKRIEYIKYWETKRRELDKAMKTLDQANLQGIRDDIDLYAHIREKISGLTSILKDMNTFTPEMHQNSNFSQLYDAIEKRIKETPL